MTNPKARKSSKSTAHLRNQDEDGGNELIVEDADVDANVVGEQVAERECPYLRNEEDSVTEEACSLTPTPNTDDDDDEEEGELSLDTCSSFSLQECIDEFKARRMRRISTQSREEPHHHHQHKENDIQKIASAPADEDLINQNRSNKEHERKCKPCKNGFCYCFTSDSGDAMGGGRGDSVGVARAPHVRQIHRRSRKSEGSQVQQSAMTKIKEHRRQSAPSKLKVQPHQKDTADHPKAKKTTSIMTPAVDATRDQLTAISRLETTSKDAPLIHIIQELRNNCVISEVRVNKHKMEAQRRSRSLSSKASPKKTQFNLEPLRSPAKILPKATFSPKENPLPSAPPLDKISELDSVTEPFVYSSSLDTSAKSNDSERHRHKAAGRLLQKRLSHTNINFKPRNLNEPPPKPPRCSLGSGDEASMVSTLASTSPSVREAERVVDEFLRSKGVLVPGEKYGKERQRLKDDKERENKRAKKRQQQQLKKLSAHAGQKKENRKSYPLTQTEQKTRLKKSLPTYPSLSDIERTVDTKRNHIHYDKNIHRQHSDKSIKEHSFNWKENDAKIHDMLNYDANANRKEFKSQAVQAGPQIIGWRIPPKIDLDTVDGEVRHNLAANISIKNTPVKTRGVQQQANDTQKFIFHEQLKSFMQSPWSNKHVNGNSKSNLLHKKPKSSLKSSSRNFLNNSKKKILKLVSPKKDNKDVPFVARKTLSRSIGIQTSKEELRYESSATPQSPPGSYFSAVQTSQQSSSMTPMNGQTETHFNFNRSVLSPPKKPTKAAVTRKLNFPLHNGGGNSDETTAREPTRLTKTYRSFHSDLDQDVTLSKMGYILSNIRAKLEASDEHAVRTFLEIERRENQAAGFDCTDAGALRRLRHQTRVDVHPNRNFAIVETAHDPIYSEIEEDSIHISSSPQFDNKTGVEHFSAEHDPAVLYAKVIKKPPRKSIKLSQPLNQSNLNPNTTLAKCMRDSLNTNIMLKPLPPPPPPPPSATSKIGTYTISTAKTTAPAATLSQSLNNIRVMEQNSPPKRHRNLSKSDLSLQRSDIFLDNLCRSEIIIDDDGALERLEKVDNRDLDASYISVNSEGTYTSPPEDVVDAALFTDKDVSYELPNDSATDCSNTAGSQLGLSCIEPPPHAMNQSSTPKKTKKPATFTAKQFLDEEIAQQLSIDISAESLRLPQHQHLMNHSSSCPTTPCKLPTIHSDEEQQDDKSCTQSLIEVSNNIVVNKSSPFCKATHARYQRLKDALRKSLRKSKHFVKNETKRLSTSLSFPTATPTAAATARHNQSERHCDSNGSSFNLDQLFALENEEPVAQQLAKAVSICRQLPDLEISPEMVEAERLLLFSTLKREMRRMADVTSARRTGGDVRKFKRFFIDAMRLPIKSDPSQDLFFNYFYICTFECEGVIKSTQSVECCNQEAIFRDCGIEFCCTEQQLEEEAEVRCEIFMLRLRKVSTISMEPKKAIVMPSAGSSLSSSCEEIVSRFRLHGCFTLSSSDFIPYEYVESESKTGDRICLRSSTTCNLSVIPRTRSTNIATELLLTGRAEVRLPKCNYSSFLNVQDPHNQHNWNRRWCTLDGMFLRVWQDANDMCELPLLLFDLRLYSAATPLECAARETCARARSFSLDCCITDYQLENTIVFFSAESQNDLNNWLLKLNEGLKFISNWMK